MEDSNNKSEKYTYEMSEAIGTPGLKQQYGILSEEFLQRLRGVQGVKKYTEMINNSSIIGQIRFLIRAIIYQVVFRFEAASNKPEAKRWAEFVEECFYDMSCSFEDFLSNAISAIDYGWAYFEIIYKLRKGDNENPKLNSQYNDGKWGWRKLDIRAQDTLFRWGFDEEGDLTGMHQFDPFSGKQAFIPIDRALLFKTEDNKGNPEGRSIWRNAVLDYEALKHITKIEQIGIERDLTGILTMRVPISLLQAAPGSPEYALRQSLEKMASEIKRDEREYVIYPPKNDSNNNPTGWDIELMSTGGKRQLDTTAIRLSYANNIRQTVLAQFLQLGLDGSSGNRALGTSFTSTFVMALTGILDTVICATINQQAIPKLMRLNKVPSEYWPELVHADIESKNLDEIGKYITALAGSGFDLSDPAVERKLLEFANLPIPEINEDDDGTAPAADDAAGPDSEIDEEKAELRFTGIQITSTIGILQEVAKRRMPRENGIKLLTTSLGLSRDQAEGIMGNIGKTFFIEAENEK